MNTTIETMGHRQSQKVILRSAQGQRDFRRIWGGIAWPEFPKPGAVCIVGELMPDKENVKFGKLILLDREQEEGIEDLLKKTTNLKDQYCAKSFYADPSNQEWMATFKKADGLTHYEEGHDDKTFFPYFKGEWLTAFIAEAPQANNPEFGLQIISDWLKGGRLLVEGRLREILVADGVFPVTKDMLKEGTPPVLRALGFVLAAYFQKPFVERKAGVQQATANWANYIRQKYGWDDGQYREMIVS